MTAKEAGRRYLQAHMSAHYTGLPDTAREAQQETMRRLARQHPDAPLRAAVGTETDFDEKLTPGEREHQRYVQRSQLADPSPPGVKAAREQLRGGAPPSTRRPRTTPRAAVRAGVNGGRGYARARRAVTQSSGVSDAGGLLLQAFGVAIGLSLMYLLLSSKGSKAFSALLSGVTSFVTLLISPIDPLNPGKQANVLAPGAQNSAPYEDVLSHSTPITKAELNKGKAFGPAPGLGQGLVQGATP